MTNGESAVKRQRGRVQTSRSDRSGKYASPSWTPTNNLAVNTRSLRKADANNIKTH